MNQRREYRTIQMRLKIYQICTHIYQECFYFVEIYTFIPEIPESGIHMGEVEMSAGVGVASTVA